jgi:hypothetical protein
MDGKLVLLPKPETEIGEQKKTFTLFPLGELVPVCRELPGPRRSGEG